MCRECKLVGVRADLLEEIASNMEEVTAESNDLTRAQWMGLLQGLAKAPNLKKLHVEPLPPNCTLEQVNLLEKASMRVTTLALATIWPGLLQGIADRKRSAVTSLDLHGVDLDSTTLTSTAMTSAFHKLTALDISYCNIPMSHLTDLLREIGSGSSCLAELNLEGIANLKDVSSSIISRLNKLDKLNLSNTGLSTDQYTEYFGKIMEDSHRTKSRKKFPSKLNLCSEQAISSVPPYLHHIFAHVHVLNISNLNLKPDLLKKIFKRLVDENNLADLEELVICDTSLASLDQGLLADAFLKLRKANIARFLNISISIQVMYIVLCGVPFRISDWTIRYR